MSAAFPETFAPSIPVPTDANPWHVEQGDAVDLMFKLEPYSVDVIVTDPAYESLEKHRAVGTTTRLKKEWFPIFRNNRFASFFQAAYRTLKPNAHLYVMCDAETMFAIKTLGEAAGFKFWKPLVWDKCAIGMGYHYRARCEFVLFFEKGKRKLNHLGTLDVLSFPRVRNGYPTEKPVELMRTLIRQSSSAGDVVLDPFCGSGATGEAAIYCDRLFLGFDISERAVKLSSERLGAL
jgi:site-specific DNA-methyltransferase (adenine-specific)